MKSKKSIYILLPAAALIWGVVIYKIFEAAKDEPIVNPLATSQLQAEDATVAEDTYRLALNYRDPFLGRVYAPKKKPVSKPAPRTEDGVQAELLMIKSELAAQMHFAGVIENPGASAKVGLVNYKGQNKLVREGDKIFDVEILEIAEDSVKIKFRDKKFFLDKTTPGQRDSFENH